ncbi:MAG TPA: (Fe-S)-binding protein [Dehalococcoidales bacterium]|nr:(Fe-S)-binding protein [Dehalococcoidales bacterium]
MNWENYEHDMMRCTRCSYCKTIPWRNVRSFDFMDGCPSVARYQFHSYASGGKFNLGYSLLKGHLEINESFLDVVYKCMMDGSCDISCKVSNDIEPLQHMQELRIKCVDDGQLLPQHQPLMRNLRKEDNMMMKPRSERGDWAEGLNVKRAGDEKAEVLYHAGCRYSYDQAQWPIARAGVELLQRAGVDLAIMGADEACCGGRAYELGYIGEMTKFAEHQAETFRTAGVKTLVTPCADCYATYKVLYDKIEKNLGIEVYHITQYLEKLITEGKLQLKKSLPIQVTYHDPCHLGRLGEPWIHWNGREYKPKGSLLYLHDPPKKYRRGTFGVYDPPRNILKSIPGLNLVEMYRIREYAWCCGAGGGVIDTYPDFAKWTGAERLREAHSVGAEAIVSACPWCKHIFQEAAKGTGDKIKVLDIIELVQQSV